MVGEVYLSKIHSVSRLYFLGLACLSTRRGVFDLCNGVEGHRKPCGYLANREVLLHTTRVTWAWTEAPIKGAGDCLDGVVLCYAKRPNGNSPMPGN